MVQAKLSTLHIMNTIATTIGLGAQLLQRLMESHFEEHMCIWDLFDLICPSFASNVE